MFVAARSHRPEDVGGLHYWGEASSVLALFAGRPFVHDPHDGLDGAVALDPTTYAHPPARWLSSIDGRFCATRIDPAAGTMAVLSDALGAYPIYEARAGEAVWVSNSAEALAQALGDLTVSEAVLADVLAGGWSLSGDPIRRAVRRVPAGVLRSYRRDGSVADRAVLPTSRVVEMFGRGTDVRDAADALVSVVRSLAEWPGRRSVVPVTGGRDSRVVLAAARAAGIEFTPGTAGSPAHPDVVVGRELCARLGVEHHSLPVPGHIERVEHTQEAAALTWALSCGTATLADGAGFPARAGAAAPELWHTGQGGEIGRAVYGAGGSSHRERLARDLYARFAGRAPGRRELVTDEAAAGVQARIRAWIGEVTDAGCNPADVPDAFYLRKRMGTWAGPTHGCVEPSRDSTSPLWSVRMLPFLIGQTREQRTAEHLHRSLTERLCPELLAVPFTDGSSWLDDGLRQRGGAVRQLAHKAVRELRRHTATQSGSPGPDPFDGVRRWVRRRIEEDDSHPVWRVADRGRTLALLDTPAVRLDEMRRYYVWRLASFLSADLVADAAA